MVRNQKKLNQFFNQLTAKDKLSYRQALTLYEALHREAVSLGAINSKNILDGIEVDLRVARVIHSLTSD
jgi:hypothetical protein